MLRIALITNFNISEKARAAMRVAERLLREDCEILIAAFNRDKIVRMNKDCKEFRYLPLDAVYKEADVLIDFSHHSATRAVLDYALLSAPGAPTGLCQHHYPGLSGRLRRLRCKLSAEGGRLR